MTIVLGGGNTSGGL